MAPCLCVFLASVLPKWPNGSSWIWAERFPSTSSTLRYTEIRISRQTMALPSETLSQALDFEKFCCLNCRTHNKQYLLQTEKQQKYTYWVAQKNQLFDFLRPNMPTNWFKYSEDMSSQMPVAWTTLYDKHSI